MCTGNERPLSETPPVIEIRNLHKSYGSLEVLKGVDIRACRGDVVSLIGSSGSGKSTLLRIVAGLDRQTAGSAALGAGVGALSGLMGVGGWVALKDVPKSERLGL